MLPVEPYEDIVRRRTRRANHSLPRFPPVHPSRKNILIFRRPKSPLYPLQPVPLRGAFRGRHGRGAGGGGREGRFLTKASDADGEVAWS
jgi:hypothetical protein